MHRQRGSEGSLGCLHRQVIFTKREIGQTCAQTERFRRFTRLSAQIGNIYREGNRPDVCTERVGRVTGLSAHTGDIHKEGNRPDVCTD